MSKKSVPKYFENVKNFKKTGLKNFNSRFVVNLAYAFEMKDALCLGETFLLVMLMCYEIVVKFQFRKWLAVKILTEG